MLDIRAIRERREELEARLRTRDRSIDLTSIVKLDEQRRRLIAQVEGLKAERNLGSQEVGRRKKRRLDEEIERLISLLPNVPHPSVPTGPEENKVVLREVGDRPAADYPIKPHLLIGEEKGILDFTRAAAITGSRFPMYVGMGARLEMALINFMFTHHVRSGYIPVLPPFLANERSFYGSASISSTRSSCSSSRRRRARTMSSIL